MINDILTLRCHRYLSLCCYCVIMLFMAFAVFSFITLPFVGDVKVFMAAADQVQYQENGGILAIFESWELKGIGNRLLMYAIYVVADSVAGYENTLAFEITSKSLYALLLIIIFAFSSFTISDRRKNRLSFFCIVTLTFFATYTDPEMQAEMTCVALCLPIIACIIKHKNWSLLVAGCIGSTLLFFKSIFILMFPAAILAAQICSTKLSIYDKKLSICFFSFIASEVLLLSLVFVIYPQEYVDMLAASSFQSTLISDLSKFNIVAIANNLFVYFNLASLMIPGILAGLVLSIIEMILWVKKHNFKEALIMLAAWVIPISIIAVSNTYVPYHFFLLALPSISSIFIFSLKTASPHAIYTTAISMIITTVLAAIWNQFMVDRIDYSMTNAIILFLFALSIILSITSKTKQLLKIYSILVLIICLFYWTAFSSPLSQKYYNLLKHESASVEISSHAYPEDWASSPVLLLDDGLSTFYKSAPSYSRYFFNLPMQRWTPDDDWNLQKIEYKRLLDYKGKYILYSSWFQVGKYPELVEKLKSEYEMLPNSNMYYYSPEKDLFSLPEMPDDQRLTENPSAYILKRKDGI